MKRWVKVGGGCGVNVGESVEVAKGGRVGEEMECVLVGGRDAGVKYWSAGCWAMEDTCM